MSSTNNKLRVRAKKPISILAVGGLLLTGCTLATGLEDLKDFKNTRIVPLLESASLRKTAELPSPSKVAKPTWRSSGREKITTASITSGKLRESSQAGTVAVVAPSVRNTYIQSASYRKTTDQIRSNLSAHCRRILAEAGIDATILRSPTINGELADTGSVGASISYDFVDLHRASLQEELASAKCQRDALTVKLNLLLFTTSQALTRAGYLAKADSLKRSSSRFAAINRRIENRVAEGSLTRQSATNLRQHLTNIKMRESFVRGEAARREIVDRVLLNNYKGLDRSISDAEWRIQEINRRKRTTDAFKVTASAGYSQTNQDNAGPGVVTSDNDFSAKVKVSLRLGALRTRRYELEDIASDARIDSLFERDRGVLWRADAIGRSNARALSSLGQRRAELQQAIATARSNAGLSGDGYDEELAAINIRAQIDVIGLKAELAGVNATIADTKKLNGKLRFRS